MIIALAFAFILATALTGGWLWTVTKLTGVAVPVVDLLIIAGLCSGLALLPGLGWVLATLIMSLLVLRTTDAGIWPDTMMMLVGSALIWLLVDLTILGWL